MLRFSQSGVSSRCPYSAVPAPAHQYRLRPSGRPELLEEGTAASAAPAHFDNCLTTTWQGGENVRKKSEAQLFLEQVEKLDARIRNKLIERQQWRDIALGITGVTEGEKVQSSGAKSKMADAVIKCVDMEAEIDSLITILSTQKKRSYRQSSGLTAPRSITCCT